jgi:hypothetical protein
MLVKAWQQIITTIAVPSSDSLLFPVVAGAPNFLQPPGIVSSQPNVPSTPTSPLSVVAPPATPAPPVKPELQAPSKKQRKNKAKMMPVEVDLKAGDCSKTQTIEVNLASAPCLFLHCCTVSLSLCLSLSLAANLNVMFDHLLL